MPHLYLFDYQYFKQSLTPYQMLQRSKLYVSYLWKICYLNKKIECLKKLFHLKSCLNYVITTTSLDVVRCRKLHIHMIWSFIKDSFPFTRSGAKESDSRIVIDIWVTFRSYDLEFMSIEGRMFYLHLTNESRTLTIK